MAWHVDITWHNVWGLLLSLTLPGHYWLTLMDHALMLVLGKGVAATAITAPVRRALHGLYASWCLAPALSRNALGHDAETARPAQQPGIAAHQTRPNSHYLDINSHPCGTSSSPRTSARKSLGPGAPPLSLKARAGLRQLLGRVASAQDQRSSATHFASARRSCSTRSSEEVRCGDSAFCKLAISFSNSALISAIRSPRHGSSQSIRRCGIRDPGEGQAARPYHQKIKGRAQHPRGCSACLAGPHGTSGEEYIHKVCLGHRILLVIGAPYPMQSVKRSKIELVRCSNVPSGSEYTSASPRLCTARENPEREIRHPRHNVTQQTPNS